MLPPSAFPFTPLDHRCFGIAVSAAAEAGKTLRAFFGKKISVQTKAVANLVSEADLAAEATIITRIGEAFPNHAILAEESLHAIEENEHLWIVDPLDGTNNFLHGIPHFAVSIGYFLHGTAKLGVIYNPITEDWFYAARGLGAWHNGRRLQVNDEAKLDETIVAVGFYYDRGRMMEATLEAIRDLFGQGIHGVRRFGAAALDLAQVARGDYGVFMEFKLQPWDHAAGGLMVQEAGGIVTDCLDQPLSWQHPSSLLATNRLLHPSALAIAKPHFQSIAHGSTPRSARTSDPPPRVG